MSDCKNNNPPLDFNADVSDDVALAEGDEAADQIVGGAHLINQLKVGRALLVGSRIAAQEAGTDEGKAYINAFSRWLKERPKLAAVNKPNRAAALWCLREQNWLKVKTYLDDLDNSERQTILLRTVRNRLEGIDAAKAATLATKPKPPPEPVPASKPKGVAAPDRVQEAADRAEIATLKTEVWRLRDKFAQIGAFLVKDPPPKAEERPFVRIRVPPLPDVLERRPKDVPPQRFVSPPVNDPDFALRKEEFEQWLVLRKEALEHKFLDREEELKKSFDAKVKAKVEAQMAREDRPGRIGEFRRLATRLATYFHTDKRKRMTDQDWDRAFSEFMSLRNLIIPPKGKKDRATSPVAPDQKPEPSQEGGPSAGALS